MKGSHLNFSFQFCEFDDTQLVLLSNIKIIKEFLGVLSSRSGVLLLGTGVLLTDRPVQTLKAVFYVLIVSSLHHARDNQDQQRLDQEKEKNGEAKNDDTHSNPQQRKPAEGKAHPPPATTTCKRKGTPIPRNFNLQTERAVRLSFTFEGHGDHYIKRVMQWCRGWVRTGRVSSFSSSYNNRKA
ncbi:hypothetical protein DAPPUDRAFT_246521 [Daphnia pulex]|uniref:Uncharacterized protein n=1 Tax=Daphnia pulex TaxID=6669 RepID=E9GQR2_DAPPU|nr:hypothetical protein DAPPUDRAFT_246521 [Daphnia pulex]|eukprot:EFX78286.1 hypothetical protein DAPPUDRAFT_246521 [Daphnia pulex]